MILAADTNSIHPIGWVLIALAALFVLAAAAMIIQAYFHGRPPTLDTPEKRIRHHALLLQIHAEKDPAFKAFALKFARLHHVLVPDCGAATSLQGEILRSVDRLAGEERRNGNLNWSKGYSQFVRFLRDTLLDQHAFDEARRSELSAQLDTIERHANDPADIQRIDRAFASLIRAAVDYHTRHSSLTPYTASPDRTI